MRPLFRAYCNSCGAAVQGLPTREEADQAWNRRPVEQHEAAPAEEMIRFCPECGRLGDIPAGYEACCPDWSEARVVPKRFAELCAETFKLCVSQPLRESQPEPPAADERAAFEAWYRKEFGYFDMGLTQCASAFIGWKTRASSPNAAGVEGRPEWADEIIDSLQGSFDTEGITESDSGDALIRLSSAIAAVEDAAESRAPRTDVAGGVAAKPVDAKARMNWTESILKNLPEHEPTYAIIDLLNDYDPDERDEILHSIRAYADGRATLALFTQYVPPQPPSADAAAAPAKGESQ
ncbi:hypothetical protein WJ04_09005 [Burkholderia vietnamiensis]|nr:hypothetical protein WJ04_09005 [Burkholderia vietnamiensis]